MAEKIEITKSDFDKLIENIPIGVFITDFPESIIKQALGKEIQLVGVSFILQGESAQTEIKFTHPDYRADEEDDG